MQPKIFTFHLAFLCNDIYRQLLFTSSAVYSIYQLLKVKPALRSFYSSYYEKLEQ